MAQHKPSVGDLRDFIVDEWPQIRAAINASLVNGRGVFVAGYVGLVAPPQNFLIRKTNLTVFLQPLNNQTEEIFWQSSQKRATSRRSQTQHATAGCCVGLCVHVWSASRGPRCATQPGKNCPSSMQPHQCTAPSNRCGQIPLSFRHPHTTHTHTYQVVWCGVVSV